MNCGEKPGSGCETGPPQRWGCSAWAQLPAATSRARHPPGAGLGGEEMGSGSGPSSPQDLAQVPCCKIWAARGHHPSSLQVRSRLRCAWSAVHGSAPNVLGGVAVTAVLSCHGDFSSSRCPEEDSAGAAMGAAAPALAVAVPGADFGFWTRNPWGWLRIGPVCSRRASSPIQPCGDEDLAQTLGLGFCAGAEEVFHP